MSDWYVNGSVGASGAGTSAGTAFRTLAEGTMAASSGDTVHVAGGVYREVLAPPAGVSVLGDPDDWFVISGGEPLPGLTPCVSGDAAVVGDLWTGMWKVTVPQTFFPKSDPLAGNLCENGVPMNLACERADRSDTFFLTRAAYYHVADDVELSGTSITGYRKPSVTDLYTKAQLENATMYFVVEPNVSRAVGVTFDAATKTLRPTGGPHLYENNSYRDSFALFNLPAAARPGEWAFTREGTTVTVYVRPASGASVPGGLIEYAARAVGLSLDGAPGVEVSNFRVRQQGCPVTVECPITVIDSDDVHLHRFGVSDTYSPGGGGYAQVFMRASDRPHVHAFELTRAQGQFGIFLSGTGASNADWPFLSFTDRGAIPPLPATVTGRTSGARLTADYAFNVGTGGRFGFAPGNISGAFVTGEDLQIGGVTVAKAKPAAFELDNRADPAAVSYCVGGSIHDFDISFTSNSPMRFYTWHDLAIWHGRLSECSRQAHGNTANFYEQCHNILFWGVDAQGADGYLTWQEGDGFVIAFSAFSASTADSGGHRAIAQQQNIHAKYPGEVFGYLPSAVLNCRTTPFPGRVADTRYGNGMTVTSGNVPGNLWTVHNNIYQGHSGEGFAAVAAWDHNVNTEPGGPGTGTVGPNDMVSSWALNYTDAPNGDFAYRPSAPVRSFAGKNWSPLVPGFRSRWPQVPGPVFETDMLGEVIDWSSPPVGPSVDLDAEYGAPRAIGAPGFPPPEAAGPPTLPGRILRVSVRVA